MKKKIYLQKKKRYCTNLIGTINKPRLSIFKSNKHIYAQLIDDINACTLIFSSTLDKTIKLFSNLPNTKKASFYIGQNIALKSLQKNIKNIFFDRGNKKYHGRIKSLAEGARNFGLIF